MTHIRTGQAADPLTREQFHERFMQRYQDPAFAAEQEALARVEAIAWQAYHEGRKAPVTRPAGPGFADPSYEASVEWLGARASQRRAAPVGRRGHAVARAARLRQ